MENVTEQHGVQASPPTGQTGQAKNVQGQKEHVPQNAQAVARERRTPGKWRAKEKRRAELIDKLNALREQERRERNSLLIQSGLMFIMLLELANTERRDKFYDVIMAHTPDGQRERAHDVFSWAEETALKRKAQKGAAVK